MQTYAGTKIIQAEPMKLGAYNVYRGWSIPADEDPNRDGYLVVYPDNYQSWSPKEIFDEAYLSLGNITDFPPFLVRVQAERVQLADKLEKLTAYTQTEAFQKLPGYVQSLMNEQEYVMKAYKKLLDQRVAFHVTGMVQG